MNPEHSAILFFKKHQDVSTKPLLLALSGGIDSMVLAHVLLQLDIPFDAAHCNFKLRSEESEEDERFVVDFCKNHHIRLHTTSFDTLKFCKQHKMGIQEGARMLRYRYFNNLCQEYGYSLIATAHHKNDFAETYLFNLLRGSGIKGLRGMLDRRDNLIRPLLDSGKEEIRVYAHQYQIPHRNDSSNLSDKYSRNAIRNKLMPELIALNPLVVDEIYQSGLDMQQLYTIQQVRLANFIKLYTHTLPTHTEIYIDQLRSNPSLVPLFSLFLHQQGFSQSQTNEILKFKSGKTYSCADATLHLYKHKAFLVKLKQQESNPSVLIQASNQTLQIGDKHFEMVLLNNIPNSFTADSLYLNTGALKFPLLIRKWKSGDRFIPFGMSGFKKVSDFLTDLKTPKHLKEQTYVLVSDGQIAAVLGHRIDNRFRLTKQSSTVIRISFEQKEPA